MNGVSFSLHSFTHLDFADDAVLLSGLHEFLVPALAFWTVPHFPVLHFQSPPRVSCMMGHGSQNVTHYQLCVRHTNKLK